MVKGVHALAHAAFCRCIQLLGQLVPTVAGLWGLRSGDDVSYQNSNPGIEQVLCKSLEDMKYGTRGALNQFRVRGP